MRTIECYITIYNNFNFGLERVLRGGGGGRIDPNYLNHGAKFAVSSILKVKHFYDRFLSVRAKKAYCKKTQNFTPMLKLLEKLFTIITPM